jgi:hypothetical protein
MISIHFPTIFFIVNETDSNYDFFIINRLSSNAFYKCSRQQRNFRVGHSRDPKNHSAMFAYIHFDL